MLTNDNILYVLGPKNSGKTTSIELLITDLTEIGYHIGTIKFTHKDVITENPNKDTAKVRKAGSKFSFFVTPLETTFTVKKSERDQLENIVEYINTTADLIPTTDLIICESLNDPPENSKIILNASNEKELKKYYEKLNDPKVLAITGKISQLTIPSWQNFPIYNMNDENERNLMCSLIINNFLLQ